MRPRRAGSDIGDVFELDVAEGVAFLQLINRSDEYGDLIRVLPGVYREKPDLESLAAGDDEAFLTFFPLEAARRRGIVRRVGRFPVPKERRKFPTFKAPGGISGSGEVLNWWIWDGKREMYVGQLTDEQLDLPVAEIVNDAAVRDRILTGWRHRDVTRRRGSASAPARAPEAAGTTHFVYFPNPSSARVSAAAFEAFGQVQLDDGAGGTQDQTLVRVLTPDTEHAEQIRMLVEELGGKYDGTETAVS